MRWFLDNDNPLRKSFNGCWETRLLPEAKALKSLSPILDMRPDFTREVFLNDETNLEEIFNFIFQIRCNLFHGSKDMTNGKDSNLVKYAGDFLKDSIDWWWASRG